MSIFYLIFILLTAYYSFRYDGIEEYDPHKRHRLWLMCIYLICLSGFSYGLGADKFVYMDEFEEYPNSLSELGDYIQLNMIFKGEMPLWTIINAVCKVYFDSFYVIQFLESIAINTVVCYLVSKYTHRYFLFLLIYFFTLQYFVFNTEVMRESFALAFILLGFDGWLSGKKWLFFIMLPIAVSIHLSAIIAILFPFAKIKLSWKLLYFLGIATFIFWLVSDVLISKVIVRLIGEEGAFANKLMIYAIQATPIFGYLRAVLTYLVFPFITIYSSILWETDDEMRKRKEKIASFMVLLAVMASSFAGFARFYNYVQIFYLIMLADFVYMLFRIKKHFIIRLGTVTGICFILMLLYFAHYKSTNTYFYEFFYPYTCILDEDADVAFRPIAHDEAINVIADDKNTREVK